MNARIFSMIYGVIIICSCLFMAGCHDLIEDNMNNSDTSNKPDMPDSNLQNYHGNSVPMLEFKNDESQLIDEKIVENSLSTIKRYDDRIEVDISTQELLPGVYTAWALTFDNPDACSDNVCGEDDIFLNMLTAERSLNWDQIEKVQISVFWITGTIVGENGKANFSNTIEVGNLPGYVNFGPSDENLFENPHGADIMIQIRYHGYAAWDSPEELGLQLTTFKGYCSEFNQEHLNLKGSPVGCYEPQYTMHYIDDATDPNIN